MKKLKMVIMAEPGVGKSTFALGAPKPFFVTTDGNYEWLEDFGAKEEDHIRVNNWSEFKKIATMDLSKYDTIVFDLIEDAFKMCEAAFCKAEGIRYVGEKDYGQGYSITREDFFLEVCKLINLDKHIIFITHSYTTYEANKAGKQEVKYYPSDRIPNSVWDRIEGRVRYFLRAYIKDEVNDDGSISKVRYLGTVPTAADRFCIARGIDETVIPQEIALDFNTFAETIRLFTVAAKQEEKKVEPKQAAPEAKSEVKPEPKIEPKPEPKPEVKAEEAVKDDKLPESLDTLKEEVKAPVEEAKPAAPVAEQKSAESNADKLARIRARLNANK